MWEALQFLLDDYSDGGTIIDDQLAYEVCFYLALIFNGHLRFQDHKYSGLHEESRLTAIVQFAIHNGFWLEALEYRLIIEYDIARVTAKIAGSEFSILVCGAPCSILV